MWPRSLCFTKLRSSSISVVTRHIIDTINSLQSSASAIKRTYETAISEFESLGISTSKDMIESLPRLRHSLQFVALVILGKFKQRVPGETLWKLILSDDAAVRGAAAHLASKDVRLALIKRAISQIHAIKSPAKRHAIVVFLAHCPSSDISKDVIVSLKAQLEDKRNAILCRSKSLEGIVLHAKKSGSIQDIKQARELILLYSREGGELRSTAIWGAKYLA